jgi:4-diphosphocytidyl-2-C-methyl-D-erythritol kinase
MVLVNPGVAVSTPGIFQKVHPPYTAPQDFEKVLEGDFQGNLIAYLKAQKNDLMNPAIQQEPVIGELMETLGQAPGCFLARMSGSGATCFALFEDEASAKAALQHQKPETWGVLQLRF